MLSDAGDDLSLDRGTSVPCSAHPLAVVGSPPDWLRFPDAETPTKVDEAVVSGHSPAPRAVAPSSPTHSPSTVPRAVEHAALQKPTPWAVTSVYSPHDWSVAPRLGFAPARDPLIAEAAAQWRLTSESEEARCEQYWHALCQGQTLLASASPEVQARIRQGARKHVVPKHLRGVLWMTVTGLALKADENEYFCRSLLHKFGYVTGPVGNAIEADLQRTFPNHPYFSGADVGLYKLKNVLHALCLRNPLIEYCQCFNFLAAFALLVVDDEERAFWLLVYILEVLLPNDYYNDALIGVKMDQVVLCEYVREKLPKLHAHLTQLEYDVSGLVPLWMMPLFVTALPAETTLRVWDYILMEAAPDQQLRSSAPMEIALALLKLAEPVLLACTEASAVTVAIRHHTATFFDATRLLATARALSLTDSDLHQRRRHAKLPVSQEIRERAQQRAEREERRLARELHRQRTPSESAGPPDTEIVEGVSASVADCATSLACSIEMDVV